MKAGALLAYLLAAAATSAHSNEPVRTGDLVEASAFLETYRTASETQSPEFYDLYSDRALIHLRVTDQEAGVLFKGQSFKNWGRELLTHRRAAPDPSLFRDVTVEQRGNRLLIHAKRFSLAHCSWDTQYRVAIEREGAGYHIVEERLTMSPTAVCPPASADATDTTDALPAPQVALGPTSPVAATSLAHWHPLSEHDIEEQAARLTEAMAAAQGAPPNVLSRGGAAAAVPTPEINPSAADTRVTP
jgi:hypothetical protein